MIREITGHGVLEPRKVRVADVAVLCRFQILGEPLTIRS